MQVAPTASPYFQSSDASPRTQPPSGPKKLNGKDLFSSLVWTDALSTSTYYSFIASLRRKIWDDVKQPSRTHGFIRVLRNSNRLIRCYTQNIDGIEAREGLCTDMNRGTGRRTRFSRKSTQLPRTTARQIPGGELDGGCEVVQLHGNLEVLKCNLCRTTCTWEDQGREACFLRGEAPTCPSCECLSQERQDRGKRGTRIGSLRPNIVLYGEEHPLADSIGKLSLHDLSLTPDLLLILGTSLQVHGLKVLVKEFAKSVHEKGKGKGKVIFVNLSKPSESVWKHIIDYWVTMDCDEWVDSVRVHRPDLWGMQAELDIQIRKPRSDPAKKERNGVDGKDKLLEREDSSAIGQDLILEPRMIASMSGPEINRGDTVSRKDAKGITLCAPLMAKVRKRDDDLENDEMDGRKAKRIAKSNVSSDFDLKSSQLVSPARPRPPLQTILNETLHPSSKASLAADSARSAMGRQEIDKISPYFVEKLYSVASRDDECHQQLRPATSKPVQGPIESVTNQQLMTPPPSGHRIKYQDLSRKRRCHTTEMDFQHTPAKRFKADLKIWEDEDIGSWRVGSASQDEMPGTM